MEQAVAHKEKRSLWRLMVMTIVLFAGAVVIMQLIEQAGNDGRIEAGDDAPNFKLVKLDGSTLYERDDYEGKGMLLNFWGTFCEPCKKEMPVVQENYATLQDMGVDFWAVNVGLAYEPYGRNGWLYEKKLALANKLIFSKWREALGGRLKNMVSGSAALQPRLTRVFTAAGMQILEGYGLTETSPVISVNIVEGGGFKIGTVGKTIANVEVKIAEDGEILVKGPNVMLGYYKDPEKTAEVMTGDYFHTGDKGEIDKEGFLKITGRKKEIFKTSGGKYISPILLENEMKQSRFIEQILVIGEGQKMPAAIVQPNFDFVKEWIRLHNVNCGQTHEEIAVNQEVHDRIKKEIEIGNQHFGKWETIKIFEMTPEIWSVDNNLLTPTFKPKREVILKKYKHLYDKIYS